MFSFLLAFQWVYHSVSGLADTLLVPLLESLPASWQASISGITQWVNVANCWFPLDFGFGLFLGWVTFQFGFICFKFVLKLIPWIG